MKANLALAGVMLSLLSSAVLAAPMHTVKQAKKAPVVYQCSKCHMIYTAAQAKADHYKDKMDGGTLVPIVPKKG